MYNYVKSNVSYASIYMQLYWSDGHTIKRTILFEENTTRCDRLLTDIHVL